MSVITLHGMAKLVSFRVRIPTECKSSAKCFRHWLKSQQMRRISNSFHNSSYMQVVHAITNHRLGFRIFDVSFVKRWIPICLLLVQR